MVGFNREQRPNQAGYQAAFDNKGKYGTSNSRPYINPDLPMYVPQDGQNCIRIVDPIELLQLGVYFFDVYFHRNVGYKNDYFLCDKDMGRGPCPSCELVNNDLWEQDKDRAKELLSEMRRLIWVIDLQKPQEAGILKFCDEESRTQASISELELPKLQVLPMNNGLYHEICYNLVLKSENGKLICLGVYNATTGRTTSLTPDKMAICIQYDIAF